ncbi:MAG: LLM class flavin-dependent oxidoreductase [Alphaproteobacteria bacterium]|nr:LLM class flavin-dependent oxidoreductase [Alphaproteobacteria bacterium]
MDFGYFTLSDNYYRGNTRSANSYIADITAEAVYAEKVGMHSAWIGEHHFSTLGVLSCPDIVLAYVAAQTRRIRLAPAVTVLPLHHPIRLAEQWATLDLLSGGRVDFACGRGYDRREYAPFKAPYEDSTGAFTESLQAIERLWKDPTPYTHRGKYWQFDDISITPRPVQQPVPVYLACFSRRTVELAARLGHNVIVAPFAVAMAFGSLANFARLYREECERHGNKPGKLMCSYFIHFADDAESDRLGRERQLRYFQECCVDALPQDLKTAPPTLAYFVGMVQTMKAMKPADLTDKSVLMGRAADIIESIQKAADAGFDEIILYFGVGLKPHAQVKEEMARFMAEVAPAFDGAHTRLRATG